ncbi:hypothetical protein LV476_04030 [Guyparkeria hydrothermalis]|uniref:hypothetical protein n=1 Tax=Guyparkeria hydrothermalis TaxID=923 RepID=UPI0020221535|nr:hypothetical protein [Guyparkeria hydrothermalis]MCL7744121.1 hypothetical protein [Guyparkeria hydrothermalis]
MRAPREFVAILGRAIVFGAAVLLGGCAALGGSDGDQRTVIVYPGGDTSLDPVILPASELPPAGKCRLWYPDRAPEDQPEPGDCEQLGNPVPPGAVLVRG